MHCSGCTLKPSQGLLLPAIAPLRSARSRLSIDGEADSRNVSDCIATAAAGVDVDAGGGPSCDEPTLALDAACASLSPPRRLPRLAGCALYSRIADRMAAHWLATLAVRAKRYEHRCGRSMFRHACSGGPRWKYTSCCSNKASEASSAPPRLPWLSWDPKVPTSSMGCVRVRCERGAANEA